MDYHFIVARCKDGHEYILAAGPSSGWAEWSGRELFKSFSAEVGDAEYWRTVGQYQHLGNAVWADENAQSAWEQRWGHSRTFEDYRAEINSAREDEQRTAAKAALRLKMERKPI